MDYSSENKASAKKVEECVLCAVWFNACMPAFHPENSEKQRKAKIEGRKK